MEGKQSNPVGRPRKYTDPQVMEDIVYNYFAECDAKDEPYVISGVCDALGIVRDTLLEYQQLEGFSDTIRIIKQKVELNMEKRALMNKNNANISKFSLINNFGWKDRLEVDNNVKQETSIKIEW